jgi:hypothetical protein
MKQVIYGVFRFNDVVSAAETVGKMIVEREESGEKILRLILRYSPGIPGDKLENSHSEYPALRSKF